MSTETTENQEAEVTVEESALNTETTGLQESFEVNEDDLLRIQNAFYKQQNAQLRLENQRVNIKALETEVEAIGRSASEVLSNYIQREHGTTLPEFFQNYELNIDTGVITRRKK